MYSKEQIIYIVKSRHQQKNKRFMNRKTTQNIYNKEQLFT